MEENQQMEFEKLKLWIDLIKWFMVSVVIALITFFFNWGLQERNQGVAEIKQYETHVELITNVDNIAKRRLLAQFFSTVTASDKLREGWKNYYNIVDAEYNLFIDSLKRKQAELDTTTTQGQIKSKQIDNTIEELNRINIQAPIVSSRLPDQHVIYFQITDKTLRSLSDSLVLKLNLLGFKAYGTEFVGTKLEANTIIYYHEQDLMLAEDLQQKLAALGLRTKLKFLKHLSKKARTGTIEIWIKERSKGKKIYDEPVDDTFE